MNITKLINHKAVGPCLLGGSVFSAGVAVGVLVERFLSKPKSVDHISVEENTHPRLFDPDNPPKPERVVITLDEARAMRDADKDEPRLEEFISPAEADDDEARWIDNPESDIPLMDQQIAYVREVMAEKTASNINPEPIPFNVLDSAEVDIEGDWDWDVEVRRREKSPEGPYQIHEDEFASGSLGFHIETLCFYAVDQLVCAQNDPGDLMYDHATKLGDFKFGYGASDEDTAYVRNLADRKDYQIIQVHDSYSESVMGIMAEDALEHDELAHMDRPLRMRRLE
jgi:hypothetical protein